MWSTVSTTLRRARHTVDELATADGQYVVACALTGRAPAPIDDARFDSTVDARRAARAASRYHEALADLDPDRPEYRFVVYEAAGSSLEVAHTREPTAKRRANGLPRSESTVTLSGDRDGEWLRMENAPVVHLSRGTGPFEDDVVSRQLEAKL